MKSFLVSLLAIAFVGCATPSTLKSAPSAPAAPVVKVVKVVNPDLPVSGDKMMLVVTTPKIVVAIDLDKTKNVGDVREFIALVMVKTNPPVALVNRVAINCKLSTVRQLVTYELGDSGEVVDTKVFQTEFKAIQEDSLAARSFQLVCGREFHASTDVSSTEI